MTPAPAHNEAVTRVGVLALQGSFREHMTLLQKVQGVEAIEVRTSDELESVAGLVIPGGESTTMALVAERWGLIPKLKEFAASGKPIWGTCAGMIFLAERAEGMCSQHMVTPPCTLASMHLTLLLLYTLLRHSQRHIKSAFVSRCITELHLVCICI